MLQTHRMRSINLPVYRFNVAPHPLLASVLLDPGSNVFADLSPKHHSLVPVEVAVLGSLGLGGQLLGEPGLAPLPLHLVGLNVGFELGPMLVPHDGGDEKSGQAESLGGDHLPLNSRGWSADQDSILVDHIHNDGYLAPAWSVVDVDNSTNLHQ